MAEPSGEDGITGVRVGSGLGHCFFCDTPIAKGEPCIERVWHHTGGAFSRNNGARTGYCPPGRAPEAAHVQCAFRLDTKGGEAMCAGCMRPTAPSRRVVNFIASREQRCTETGPLRWCFPCTSNFVNRHQELLDGWLGAEQMQQGVAWIQPPLFKRAGLQHRCGLPPMVASVKEEFVAIFRSTSEEAERLAVERHQALQTRILEALDADKALKGTQKLRVPTPVERKAKRMRIDSASPLDQQAVKRRWAPMDE